MHCGSLVRHAFTRAASLSSVRTLRSAPSRRLSVVNPRAMSSFGATASEGVTYGFSSSFDSGNGELVSATPDTLTVRMRPEPYTEADGRAHFQWFHFRVTGANGAKLRVVIQNAGDASYPDGWRDYKAFVSADRKTWRRIQTTTYVDGELRVDMDPVPGDCVHLAYFVPYGYEKHLDLIAHASNSSPASVSHVVLGNTLDGRPLDCLRFGQPGSWIPERAFAGESPEDEAAIAAIGEKLQPWVRDGGAKRVVWILGRQHPGESMASWWMEGFVRRLMDAEDPVARKVPYCFIIGGEGCPGWDERRAGVQRRFKEAYARACPDFQTVFPLEYGTAPAGNVVTAKTQVTYRYGCVGMTLEMPFKDNAQLAQPDGWTPARCEKLGAAAVDALLDVLPVLRE